VASSAIGTELSIVNIVGAMAITAAASETGLLRQRTPVAAVARDRCMCALEHKVCLPVMVEKPLAPIHRVVAQRAAIRESTVMRIILPMTIDARGRRIFEHV